MKMDGAKYKELVKRAIGKRTQKDFASFAGLSQYSITRLMNSPDDKVPVPRIETIKRIANASEGRVTEAQLLSASGLTTEPIAGPVVADEENGRKAQNDVSATSFMVASKLRVAVSRMAGSAMKYDSLETFLETASITAGMDGSASGVDGSVRVEVEAEDSGGYDGPGVFNSESLAHCTYLWRCGFFMCKLYLSLHYCKTVGGGVIVSSPVFDLSSLIELQHGAAGMFLFHLMEKANVDCSDYKLALDIQDDTDAMKRLFRALFGSDDKD